MKKVKNKFVSLKRFVPKKLQNVYLGYTTRVILSLMGFVILFSVSLLCLSKTLTKEEGKVTRYSENGNLDYKVYLKENEFYENPYLGKNMYYIASLIKNINVYY